MHTELSERANAMLSRGMSIGRESISRRESFTKSEVIEALNEIRCPLFEPFIDYLLRFSGRTYEVRGDTGILLPPYPARRWLRLRDTVFEAEDSEDTGWTLICGEHDTAQSQYEMDETGVVHFFEV